MNPYLLNPSVTSVARLAVIALFVGLGGPASVLAQAAEDQPAPAEATSAPASPGSDEVNVDAIRSDVRKWTVSIEPVVWYVAPSGDVRLPGTPASAGGFNGGDQVDVIDLNLDSPLLSPSGFALVNLGEFRLGFSASDYSADRSFVSDAPAYRIGDVQVNPGTGVTSSLDFFTAELTAGMRVWSYDFKAKSGNPSNASDMVLNLHLLGGVRGYDVEFKVERAASGGVAGADELFIEPIGGARLELEIVRDFAINVQATAGYLPLGDRSVGSVDIIAGFQWHPFENIGLQLGYRQLAYWLEDGDGADKFEYDGRLAGLFFGAVIRF